MPDFTLFDDEVLPLKDVLELIDYEEDNPEDSYFLIEADKEYKQFLARLAELQDNPESESETV